MNLAAGATLRLDATNYSTVTDSRYVFTPASVIAGPGSVQFFPAFVYDIRGVYDITGTTLVAASVHFHSPITSLGSALRVEAPYSICDLRTSSVHVSQLTLKAGSITGTGFLTINGPSEWKEGSLCGGGTTNATSGVFFNGMNRRAITFLLMFWFAIRLLLHFP